MNGDYTTYAVKRKVLDLVAVRQKYMSSYFSMRTIEM